MNEPLFMGIDGGGSTLRIAIVNAKLDKFSSLKAGAVNPSVVGHSEARARIQRGVGAALGEASLRPERISAVGIGVAGASNLRNERWLLETLKPVLPRSRHAPSSDLEIALAGALARRHGILLLAGTGSGAFAVKPGDIRLQVGGWGYLLGDEGSSYWIGRELLRLAIGEYDLGWDANEDALGRAFLDELGLAQARELLAWVYQSDAAPAVRIGGLAPFVLKRAEDGDEQAMRILRRASEYLADQLQTLRRRLDYPEAPIAFAGGLLDNDNWLSREVSRRLALAERPVAKHPPVIGAAMLAKMEWSAAKK
ncbi:MAG: hypothetical protein OXG84_16285 [Chloroflexi bacterium]|nr:hypothetical protein [Chloroflexota bacterium]